MALKRAEFDALEAKLRLECRNTKDRICWFIHEGKKVLFTKRSHAKGDLPAPDKIRQQLSVNETQFRGLISCSFSLEDYIAHLKERGKIA
jgi:hypothetical protein